MTGLRTAPVRYVIPMPQKDERVQVIHKENGGLSSARNAALVIAQGEYIGFVDSDDYISVDMFENYIRPVYNMRVSCNMLPLYGAWRSSAD